MDASSATHEVDLVDAPADPSPPDGTPEAPDAAGGSDGSVNGGDGGVAAGGSAPGVAEGPSVAATLAAVQDSALHLLAGFSRPPSALRIQAGGVTVEATWGTPPPVPPAAIVATGAHLPGAPVVAAPPPPAAEPGAGEAAADAPGAAGKVDRHHVCAPTVGIFYRAPEPGAPPFVEVGDVVRPGQQVAIVETMKLLIPVKADQAGTVVEILKEDGEGAEHGEPLMALAPPAP
jgi:acetyl-CoA carboxylase biotin carboxyl carrier protein